MAGRYPGVWGDVNSSFSLPEKEVFLGGGGGGALPYSFFPDV
jgi:hypothetical protein